MDPPSVHLSLDTLMDQYYLPGRLSASRWKLCCPVIDYDPAEGEGALALTMVAELYSYHVSSLVCYECYLSGMLQYYNSLWKLLGNNKG